DLVVWATGAAAHPFVAESALPAAALDERGFARIGATLEVAGCDGLFAVGDCASLPGTAKAGVYAVRQGPVLADNLRAAHRGEPLARYAPQRDFLRLLNLGDGTAIAAKWGLAARGALAMRLKDRIDRGFMRRYR
ncbi:MAG: FAD-dependent oxidoreductase, partial [Myxococcales bacterium]|nr:FAD-dependent oxidoreductase [Myxococcales bacterium]